MAAGFEAHAPEKLIDRIVKLERLDGLAEIMRQMAVGLSSMAGRRVTNAMHGTWLGHPVHPLLIVTPLGAWITTAVLDVMEARGSRRARLGSDVSLGVGLVGALLAAPTGLNDWQHTSGRAWRIGALHGALNGVSTLLYAGSLLYRLAGARRRGRALSWLGFGISNAAAYLGGALTYNEGVGVDRARGTSLPPEYTRLMLARELRENIPGRAEVAGSRILVLRRGETVFAIAETCAHLGGPLSEGDLEGDTITCPWHGSRFDVRTGELRDGPAVYAQPCFPARIRDGWVEVRGAVR